MFVLVEILNESFFVFVFSLLTFVSFLAADRNAAVVARQALSGFRVNGGQLRINFAKETGRLGTSFDLTYNTNTGPNALRNNAGPPPSSLSYYGRGGF